VICALFKFIKIPGVFLSKSSYDSVPYTTVEIEVGFVHNQV